MSRKIRFFIVLFFSSICIYSCSSVRHLSEDESMLVRNKVKVVDAKSPNFDNLTSYVRPVTNKKFMDIFRVKTVLYDWGTPKYNKKGELKDGKFRKFLREKVGEPPALLDSVEITNSLDQLKIVMKQLGYFDAEVDYRVQFLGKNRKKSKVDYFVTAHDPYFISQVDYDIPVPEYKRIVVIHQKEKLLEAGMQYNENIINQELTRIINLIRNEGYYYVEKSIIQCEVMFDPPDSLGNDPKTVNITIMLNIPQNENASRYLYKYYYNNNYVNPEAQMASSPDPIFDTTYYRWHERGDTCHFYFIDERFNDKILKPYFSYKTLADAIYSCSGYPYSQLSRNQSSRALNSLDNFDYISISYRENEALLDTIKKVGYLDVFYQLNRKKQHSVGGQVELRNDKSALSINYTNRNIFKGAEHLSIGLSGGYFYYSLSNLFKNSGVYSYPEFGATIKLEIPNRLFLFNRHRSSDGTPRSTSINFGVNYSGLYNRLLYNSALTYKWIPTSYISHSFSPLDVSTIDNSDRRTSALLNFDAYPESYQYKFGKFMLISAKYTLNYLVPISQESNRHNMNISLICESSGLLVKGLNAIFDPTVHWVLGKNVLDSEGYDYTTFEKVNFTWNYTYTIDNNNAIAMRTDLGCIIPLDKFSHIPYEKGFYMGTSNSMRGWGYRGLGPGSYKRGSDSLYTGDIKIELNLEYRGPIYRSVKFGVFVDVGNIWLARKEEDMPGAEFSFKRFYKELAMDAGVGLRLDLKFLVIRLDFALPIYDPTRDDLYGHFINLDWIIKDPRGFRIMDGLKLAIGYAF